MKVEVNLLFNVVDKKRLFGQANLLYDLQGCEGKVWAEDLTIEEVVADVVINCEVLALDKAEVIGWEDLGLERISR